MENGKNILETNDKNTAIISDLCALRSGMSVISQKFDNICAKTEEINEILSKTVIEHNEVAKEVNQLISDTNKTLGDLGFGDDEQINFEYPADYNENVSKQNQDKVCADNVEYLRTNEKKSVSEITYNLDKSFDLLNLDNKNVEELLNETKDKYKKINALCDKVIENRQQEKAEKEQKRNSLKKPVEPKYITHGKPPKALMIIFYILGIYALVMIAAMSLGDGFSLIINEEINGIHPYILMLIGGVVFTVLAIIMSIVRKKYFLEQELREKYCTDLFHFKNKFNTISNEIDDLTNSIDSLENSRKVMNKEFDNVVTLASTNVTDFEILRKNNLVTIKTTIIPEIERLAKESEEIKNGLIKSFDAVINQADWQNIDLIIFNMTSGRAETFKESLQLVDRVSLNETTAVKTIGDTFYKRYADFGSVITQSFEKLSDSVHLSTTELGNALIEKSNETSGKLYNDIIYVSGIIKQ